METRNNVRPPATLTVLEKSRELHILLSKVTLDDNLLQKVYRFTVGKAITDHSQDIYESLAVANSLDLYDKDLTEERLRYQTQARRAVTKLLAALRVMYTVSQMSSDKMKILIDKTIEVERLLKKWMESDRNRVGASLGVVKKDMVDNTIFNNQITAHDLFSPSPHIDFDILLKDSRNQIPPVPHHESKRLQFIPPGESIRTPPPEIKYVVKSDEQRAEEFKQSRFEFDKKPEVPPMPISDKPKSQFAIPTRDVIKPVTTKPVVEVVVRDKPIIVPDDRTPPEPPPPTLEEQLKTPLDPKVQILHGGTAEGLTELDMDLPGTDGATGVKEPVKEKGVEECPSQPISSVQPDVSTTEPKTPTDSTVTPVASEPTSTSVSEKASAPSPSSSTSTSES